MSKFSINKGTVAPHCMDVYGFNKLYKLLLQGKVCWGFWVFFFVLLFFLNHHCNKSIRAKFSFTLTRQLCITVHIIFAPNITFS